MKEKLSALMDGEWADEDLAVIARVRDDAELCRAWDAYHLIGDTLRGHAGADLAARVSRRLAAEPTVLAPPRPATGRIAWYAMSAAASVAAVALVAWTALPLIPPRQPLTAGTAASAPFVPIAANALAPEATRARVATAEVEDYLLAHQPYSHTSAMQGVAPYVRTVAERNRDGGDGGKR